MNKGWQRKRLGDVLEVQNGYAFASEAFNRSKGLPLIRIRSLKAGVETETRYDGEYDPKYVVRAGDLLIGMDGEFGCYEWTGEPSLLNQRVCRLQEFSRELLPRFLFYGVNDYLKAIEEVTGYATVKHLSSKQILAIEFPVPPLPEQQRIAGMLDEVFANLAIAQANAERNFQKARALFDSHLQSVFSSRGSSWAVKRLGDVGTTQTGSTPKTTDKSNYGNHIPFIKPGDFNADGTLRYSNDGLSKKGLNVSRKLAASSVLMVCIGATIGKCGYCDRDVTTNQQINALTPYSGIDHLFIYFQMLTEDFQRRVRLNAGQATLPIISKGKWSALTVVVPESLQEQKRISGELCVLSAETQRLASIYEQKQLALAELKKSLLHQAFTGEL